MKEKLRKLDGKPTEPGDYRYKEYGVSHVVKVAIKFEYLAAYFPGQSVGIAISAMDGQWSERIPDGDWEAK